MRIVTCEDNTIHRQRLQKVILSYIFSHSQIEIVLNASTPNEVLSFIKEYDADCFLLDIDLNDTLTGFDIAKAIREHQPTASIIFVTTHADKLKMTFTYQIAALDFVIKNADTFENDVHRALQAAIKHHDRLFSSNDQQAFAIKVGEYIKQIPYKNIYYFQTSVRPHKIELKEKNGIHTFYDKLSDIEKKIDERFVRCHRGYIVNIEHVQEINKKERKVILHNGLTIPTSLTYQGGLQKCLLKQRSLQ
ncbi:LytTR family DNA-binding domain-containing protein [Metasolibacillus sp.]|uniref:LytR/AlgR family response regulator transcription factor n=1 Tax=Metasolibacillus sp. TaxID=2703680 RepID=UPI0025F58892|nr:LytTR family DNA-binding domain-containing protein [Metasolibacillus sp.]MCT6926324.1 LytTR family DNA-binding domain-containing protein [Metasolibacillus sp.]MCT6942585.1 LytTR family DNA-binding domain-containing protein [Metasolibacillus sp.]